MHIYGSLSLRAVRGEWLTGESSVVAEGLKAAGGSVSLQGVGVL